MTDSISTPLNDSVVWVKHLPAQRHLTEEEFIAEFNPQKKDSGDLLDYQDVLATTPPFVWTIVETGDAEDENWYALPGFHIVNKMGYVVSNKAWTTDIADAVYFDASGFEKDDSSLGFMAESWFSPETLAKADAFTGWVTDLMGSVSPEVAGEIADFGADLGEAISRIDVMPATDAEHDAFDSVAIDFARAAITVMVSKSEQGA